MNAVLRILAWLLAVAVVVMPVVAVLNGWVGAGHWPLSRLQVSGQFARVQPEQLRAVVLPYASRGFFAVDLEQAQSAVGKLPWVESAQVSKRWPDVLEVKVVEHRPFARWGSDRMLSEHGDLFPIPKELTAIRLPQLGGPDTKTTEVVALYNEAQALFAPTGVAVEQLVMDARGSWSLRLSNGVQVVIGRDDARARLGRFVRLMPQLLARQPQPLQRADLRYANGFALSWGAVAPRSPTSPSAPAAAHEAGVERNAQARI